MEMDICGKKMRSDYKLIYENSDEITELIQIALAYAKVPYDDVHHEEGFPLKFSELPVLEKRGQTLSQGSAILRYLARRHGLVGEDDWIAAQIEAYVDKMIDIMIHEIRPLMMNDNDTNEQKDRYIETILNPFLKRLEERLDDNGTGFLFGRKATLADLALFMFYGINQSYGFEDALKNWVLVTKLFDRITNISSIQEWVEK